MLRFHLLVPIEYLLGRVGLQRGIINYFTGTVKGNYLFESSRDQCGLMLSLNKGKFCQNVTHMVESYIGYFAQKLIYQTRQVGATTKLKSTDLCGTVQVFRASWVGGPRQALVRIVWGQYSRQERTVTLEPELTKTKRYILSMVPLAAHCIDVHLVHLTDKYFKLKGSNQAVNIFSKRDPIIINKTIS